MKWERATIFLRLVCLLSGACSFVIAWHLRNLSLSGIEDVPPPFILLPALAGVALICVAVIGRYPWR